MVSYTLHITYLLTNNVDTRDPIGSKNMFIERCFKKSLLCKLAFNEGVQTKSPSAVETPVSIHFYSMLQAPSLNVVNFDV